MITMNQIVKKKARLNISKSRPHFFYGRPQLQGTCVRVYTMKPRKPNSAVRKVAKVKLSIGKSVIAYIPGSGHNLIEYATVLVRGGRVKDLPGVHYHLIRGKYDFSSDEVFFRSNRRSKYGTKKKDIKALLN